MSWEKREAICSLCSSRTSRRIPWIFWPRSNFSAEQGGSLWRGPEPGGGVQNQVGDQFGDSLFVELPSEREARLVCSRAGVPWPTSR